MSLVRVQLEPVRSVGDAAGVAGRASIAHIVLSRPDKKNALTPAMLDELLAAVRSSEVQCAAAVVLSGEVGHGGFCSGFDLKLCIADHAILAQFLSGLSATILAMRATAAPVVIGAHGTAIAGGCALLGGADVVVASSDLKLGYPVVRLGISPAVSAPFLTQSVGYGHAREMLLEPTLISAARGHELGLIHELVPDDVSGEKTIARAIAIAHELAAKPRAGVQATKRWMNELADSGGDSDCGSGGSTRASAGLEASLSVVGTEEQRRMLAAAFSR